MRAYGGVRRTSPWSDDVDYGAGLPTAASRGHIVCRNPSDRPQPGLHPYDCPNLLWELKRAKRVEMTARQLLTKNPSENLQDKNNHLRDCMKYLTGSLRNPTEVPLAEIMEEKLAGLDAMTAPLRARFLMSSMALTGKLGPDGKPRMKKVAPAIDLRRSPGVIR